MNVLACQSSENKARSLELEQIRTRFAEAQSAIMALRAAALPPTPPPSPGFVTVSSLPGPWHKAVAVWCDFGDGTGFRHRPCVKRYILLFIGPCCSGRLSAFGDAGLKCVTLHLKRIRGLNTWCRIITIAGHLERQENSISVNSVAPTQPAYVHPTCCCLW